MHAGPVIHLRPAPFPLIQRQEDPQGRDEQPAQEQARDAQPQQQPQQNGGGVNLTEAQIREFAATVMAESNPGRRQGQEEEFRWVYYNLIRNEGFEDGLNRSAAHSEESPGYQFWATVLGDEQYRENQPPRWDDAREEYDTMGAFVDAIGGRYRERAVNLEESVRQMIRGPVPAEYQGFTGQGNRSDINLDTRYWRQARQYYRMQQGEVDGVDPDTLTTYVRVVNAPGNADQVIFDSGSIRTYFSNHPERLPDDVPDVDITR